MTAELFPGDGRIPVVAVPILSDALAAPSGPDDVLLRPEPEVGVARPGHGVGCGCCVPRGAIAAALSQLYLACMRSNLPPPRRVRVVADPDALAAAFATDVVLRARFLLEAAPPSG